MKVFQILCPEWIKESELNAMEANLLTIWRIIPAGKAIDWVDAETGQMALRDTHDEETGEVLYGPYRGRHIVDGLGNIICEFIHELNNASLIAAAPRLMAALERCVKQIEQMQDNCSEQSGAIQMVLEEASEAIDLAMGKKKW